jgi:hypothetical protein
LGASQKSLTRVLGLGTLSFGVLGVAYDVSDALYLASRKPVAVGAALGFAALCAVALLSD